MKKEKTKFNYKSFITPLVISIMLGIVISIISIFISDTAFYKSFENIFQRSFLLKQNEINDSGGIYYYSKYLKDFALIEIDEKSLQTLNTRWPIPRSYYATIIEKLHNAGAKLICFDIIFPEKSIPAEDKAFAEQIKKTPNILLGYQFAVLDFDKLKGVEHQKDQIIYPYSMFLNALGNNKSSAFQKLGFISTITDPDGLIRRIPLIRPSYKIENSAYDMTSFSAKILMNLLNANENDVKVVPEKDILLIKDKIIPINTETAKNAETGEEGNKYYTITLNFGFTTKNNGIVPETIPFSDVINASQKDLGYFKDRIVVIGTTATAAYDEKYFPVGNMPGVYGHFNTIFTVLENKFIRNLPFYKQMLWILIFGIIVGFFAALFKPRYSLILLIVLLTFSIFISYKIFVNNCIFMPMFPTIANIALVFITVSLYKYQQEQQAKKRLSVMIREFAPLPPDYLEKVIAEKTGAAQFGGKKEKLTILFSDIRGYTNLSEKLDPVEVMNTLNEYHGAMGEIFEKNGGVIFDYQGDAQMVVFGLVDPSREEHAFYAVKSGIEMQERVKKLVEKWGKKHEFEIGVGVCTGEVSLGIVGSAQRKQYAAIGDSTNVSARLQGMSKQLESPVLISDTAYEMCKDKIIADKLEPVSLKGKSEPLQVYRARGIKA